MANPRKAPRPGKAKRPTTGNSMEYIIWGVPPGEEHEEPLVTGLKTKAKATEIMAMFNNERDRSKPWYGVTKVRIHSLDLSEPPDFTKAIQ